MFSDAKEKIELYLHRSHHVHVVLAISGSKAKMTLMYFDFNTILVIFTEPTIELSYTIHDS